MQKPNKTTPDLNGVKKQETGKGMKETNTYKQGKTSEQDNRGQWKKESEETTKYGKGDQERSSMNQGKQSKHSNNNNDDKY